MDPTTFANALKIMRGIDHAEFGGLHDWTYFRDDPFAWFVRSTDGARAKLWAIMVKRDPRLAETTAERPFASRIADIHDVATLRAREALQAALDADLASGGVRVDGDQIIFRLLKRGFGVVPVIVGKGGDGREASLIVLDDGHGRGEVREAVLSPRARQAALRALEKEFKTWRTSRGLTPANGDAEDVRYHPKLSEIDRQWLDHFAERWDAASCGEVWPTKVQP